MKKLYIFLALMFISLLLYPINNNAIPQKVTLQLHWKHQFQSAGYYIAQEKGFYKDAGLDVEIKEYDFNHSVTSMLLDKQAEFGVGRSNILIEYAQGKDIVALGAILQSSPLALIVLEDSGINTLEDLKNKRVMMTSDAKQSASIIAMLNTNGITLEDLKIQTHSCNIDDLLNHKTDAMAIYTANEPFVLEEKNVAYKLFSPKVYGFNFFDDILYTTSEYLDANSDTVEKFYRASLKGWEYAFDNIGETAETIFKNYNTQNKSRFELVREGEELKKLAFDKWGEIGIIDESQLEKVAMVYRTLGEINSPFDLKGFIYGGNHSLLHHINLSDRDIISYIIIGILVLILFLGTAFIISIKVKFLRTNKELTREIRVATKKLKQLTKTDKMTNIGNRRAYDDKIIELLEEHKRYGTTFSYLMLDIDHFKRINDTYGHKAGDEVLIHLTNIVREKKRKTDFFFRIGGEEFVVILNNTDLEGAMTQAEKLREAVKKECDKVTISIGVTMVKDGDTEDSIFKRADSGLYEAKENGRDRVVSKI
jgi:diguanylate cyclase (GGDEF)-like protein